MLGRVLWARKPRFGPRSRLGILLVVAAALLALLFVDSIELWVTTMNMNTAVEPLPPQGVPAPTRWEEFLLSPGPQVCQRVKPYLLTLVVSAPANQRARQAIRETWGGVVEAGGRRVVTLFVVGEVSDPGLAELLAEESREHGDLVQGRFPDSYANLTLKTLSMMAWTRRFCPQARFMAKVDDDVLFNPDALLRFLNEGRDPGEHGDLYLGSVHLGVAPNRDPESPHYQPSGAYPPDVYPDYCSGTAYVLSRSALLKLSTAAATATLSTPLPPEDVFVGLCARAAGVLPTHCPLFSGSLGVPYGRCCYQAMVSIHHTPPRDMLRYWADSHSSPPCSWLGTRASLGICKVRAMLWAALGREEGF